MCIRDRPASVAAGFIVGKREIIDKERLDNLIGELAQLAITVLFPLLASDVSWGELSPLYTIFINFIL